MNNFRVLHARTAFTDWDDAERRRWLLRIWLCPPIGQTLAPEWADQASGHAVQQCSSAGLPSASFWAPARLCSASIWAAPWQSLDVCTA